MSFDLPAKLSIEKLAQQESRAALLLLVLNPPGASELSELVKNLRFSNPTQVYTKMTGILQANNFLT